MSLDVSPFGVQVRVERKIKVCGVVQLNDLNKPMVTNNVNMIVYSFGLFTFKE